MCWPSPVASACRSAARIATVAYIPHITSAIPTPTLPARRRGSPVTLMMPP